MTHEEEQLLIAYHVLVLGTWEASSPKLDMSIHIGYWGVPEFREWYRCRKKAGREQYYKTVLQSARIYAELAKEIRRLHGDCGSCEPCAFDRHPCARSLEEGADYEVEVA